MAELSRFYGIVVMLFFRGEFGRHNRPHVHAMAGDNAVSVDIATLEVLAGRLPRPDMRRLKRWIALHRSELLVAWEAAKEGTAPARIAPLPPRKGAATRRRANPRQRVPLPTLRIVEWLGGNEVRLFFSTGRVMEIALPWVRSARRARIVARGVGLDPGDGREISAWTLSEAPSGMVIRPADGRPLRRTRQR